MNSVGFTVVSLTRDEEYVIPSAVKGFAPIENIDNFIFSDDPTKVLYKPTATNFPSLDFFEIINFDKESKE